MLTLPRSIRVFVVRSPVDFRKSHDGLSGIVVNELLDSPRSGHLYVFFNRRRDRIKILFHDGAGLWLLYQRLDRGVFQSTVHLGGTGASLEIDMAKLQMLLRGIDLRKSKIRRHFGARQRKGA